MVKKICGIIVVISFAFLASGCMALLETALAAGASYGIYQATKGH